MADELVSELKLLNDILAEIAIALNEKNIIEGYRVAKYTENCHNPISERAVEEDAMRAIRRIRETIRGARAHV